MYPAFEIPIARKHSRSNNICRQNILLSQKISKPTHIQRKKNYDLLKAVRMRMAKGVPFSVMAVATASLISPELPMHVVQP
jgi:hypothetical protein